MFFEQHAGASHLPFGEEDRPNKTVVSTYAQFGAWVSRNPDFAANFEVIICDEAHNIVLFPTYSPEPNFASIARDAICEAASGGRTLVVGITATPEPLERLACPQHIVPIDQSVLRQYENKEVRPYSSLPQLFSQIPEGKRGMLYEYGDRLSYEAVRYQTQRACQEAKVEYRGMHVFRHTFATNCYHKKVDIKILSRLLGHADTNITYNIYVHLYGDGFEEMYDAIAR